MPEPFPVPILCLECSAVRDAAFVCPVTLPEAGPEPYLVGALCARCSAKYSSDDARRTALTAFARALHQEIESLPPYTVVRRTEMQRHERCGEPTPNAVEFIVEGPGGVEYGPFLTETEAAAEANRLNSAATT